MFGSIVGIAIDHADSCSHSQHITALFNRHIPAIGLAVSQRISTDIMSRKRLRPFSALTVIENMIHQSFRQIGIINQKQRHRRIGNIDGTDWTVTEILLRKKNQISFFIFDQLMCSNGLTISQGTQFSIFFPTDSRSFIHQLYIKISTTIHNAGIFCCSRVQFSLDSFIPFPVPIRTPVFSEILDSIQVVVSQQNIPGSCLTRYLSQILSNGQHFQFHGQISG